MCEYLLERSRRRILNRRLNFRFRDHHGRFSIDSFVVKSFLLFIVALLAVLFVMLILSGVKPDEILHNPAGVLKSAYNQLFEDNSGAPPSAPAPTNPEPPSPVAQTAPAPEENKPAIGEEVTVNTTEPAVDLTALIKNAGTLPKSVTLKTATAFPVMMNGSVLGNAEVSAGTSVILVAIQEGRLELDYQGGKQTVAVEATDLVERLQSQKQAQPPSPPPAVKPPKPKPAPVAVRPTPTPAPPEPAPVFAKKPDKTGKAKETFFGTLGPAQ